MRAPDLNRGQRDTKSTHTYMNTNSLLAFWIDTQGPWAQDIPAPCADGGKMILEKLEKTRAKYPIDKSYGSSEKYDRL